MAEVYGTTPILAGDYNRTSTWLWGACIEHTGADEKPNSKIRIRHKWHSKYNMNLLYITFMIKVFKKIPTTEQACSEQREGCHPVVQRILNSPYSLVPSDNNQQALRPKLKVSYDNLQTLPRLSSQSLTGRISLRNTLIIFQGLKIKTLLLNFS